MCFDKSTGKISLWCHCIAPFPSANSSHVFHLVSFDYRNAKGMDAINFTTIFVSSSFDVLFIHSAAAIKSKSFMFPIQICRKMKDGCGGGGGWQECSSEEELFVDAANNESNGTERIEKVKEANNGDSQREWNVNRWRVAEWLGLNTTSSRCPPKTANFISRSDNIIDIICWRNQLTCSTPF